MNRQEIFNKVATHLLRQGKASLTFGICTYRGDDGTKCAIGIFIPDGQYSPYIEGKRVNAAELYSRLPSFILEDLDFARMLQHLHDCHENWSDIYKSLQDFALRNKLEMPVVEEIKGNIR